MRLDFVMILPEGANSSDGWSALAELERIWGKEIMLKP